MIEIGQKVGGRYKIIRLIGSGGMSNVYLGHDLILDRDVAVKVLRFDFQNNREALRRFQREALSATQLVHPNIVSVYDVDEDEGHQYIIMEYVEGTDLKQRIRDNGPTSPTKAIHLMGQVLSAIALAHRNRIIHRDIKAQNLLIDQDNTIKVTDFCISVALSDTSITQTNTLLGSVHYISPEQARGSVTTTKSDIYALGIVLYELLSGDVPFDGESAVSIALKHFQDPMPSVRDVNPAVPQSLENVILKATAKEPTDRYDSCEDMLMDLERSLSPSRMNEPVFTPIAMLDETKIMPAINPNREQATVTAPVTEVNDPKITTGKERDKTNKKDKKSKKKGLIIGLLLFLLAAVLAIFLIWNNREPAMIEVPKISNVSENVARSMLEEAGLTIGETIEEYDEDVAAELVIRTDPEAGEMIGPDTEVDLILSMGPEPFEIGDYLGQDYQEVSEDLREKGFIVERIDQFDEAESGTIIGQSIDAGEALVIDRQRISLTVSMGEQTFTMDSLSGYSRVSVEDFARRYDLDLKIEEESSEDIATDLVIAQSIDPQSNFKRGDSLVVTISTGPAEPEILVFSKSITIPYEAPEAPATPEPDTSSEADSSSSESKPDPKPTENHIIIYMEDTDHQIKDVFREFNITADYDVTLNFRILEGNPGAYIVERDGEIIMQENELVE